MTKPEIMPLYIVPIALLRIGKHLWETLVSKPLKRPRTAAQIAIFEKARAKRAENLAKYKWKKSCP